MDQRLGRQAPSLASCALSPGLCHTTPVTEAIRAPGHGDVVKRFPLGQKWRVKMQGKQTSLRVQGLPLSDRSPSGPSGPLSLPSLENPFPGGGLGGKTAERAGGEEN